MPLHLIHSLFKPKTFSGKGPFPFLPTPSPKDSYDIVVIGGGIEAVTTAYVLSKHYGLNRVALLEREDFYESHGEELLIPYPLRLETVALFTLSLEIFRNFLHAFPAKITYGKRKFLNLVTSDSHMRFAVDQSDILSLTKTAGWMVPPQEIHIHAPLLALPAATQGALLYPEALSVDRRTLYFACAHEARKQGVTFINKCEALDIATNSNRITGVHTNQGLISGKHLIVTTPMPSLADFYPPLTLKTCCELTSLPAKIPFRPVLFSLQDRLQILLNADHAFNIRDFSANNSPALTAHKALRLLPQLSQHSITAQRTRHTRTFSDGLPVIGKAPVEGLFFHLGLGWNKYSFALGAAAALASSMVSRKLHPALCPLERRKES